MSDVTNANFNGLYNYAQGKNLLDKNAISVIKAADEDIRLRDSAMSDLFFTSQTAKTENDVIYTNIGDGFLDEAGEGERATFLDTKSGRKKGFEMRYFKKAIQISDVLVAWLKENDMSTEGVQISAEMREELGRYLDNAKELMMAKHRTLNKEMLAIYNQATIATNSYGAGSPSPDGKALADTGRTSKLGNKAWANKTTGAFTVAKLKEMIGQLRDARWDNGTKVGPLQSPNSFYTLMYPSSIADTVIEELNTIGNTAGVYAGTGNNANDLSLFVAPGFKVRLFENPLLEDESLGGSETQFHLVNGDLAMRTKAFRVIDLPSYTRLESGRDTLAGVGFLVYQEAYAVDHYCPQVISTSTGV